VPTFGPVSVILTAMIVTVACAWEPSAPVAVTVAVCRPAS
jgi:hypothetical protein